MKGPFDPKTLEPKNGDFASFVDELNRESVQHLKALQVSDAQMQAQQQADIEKNKQIASAQAQGTAPVAASIEAIYRDERPAAKPSAPKRTDSLSKKLPLLAFLAGFIGFAYGASTGQEDIVSAAFTFCFIAMILMAVLNKKRR